jgi:thiol-disulfide isomerase/thioredoxin
MKKKLTIGLTLAIVLSSLVLIQVLIQGQGLERKKELNKPLQVGDIVKVSESAEDIWGNRVSLQGLVLFLFFNPNCGPCVDEAPIWDDFHNRFGDEVQVVGIGHGDAKSCKNFVSRVGVSYQIISDYKRVFFESFRVASVPYSVLMKNEKVEVAPTSPNQSPSRRMKEIEDYLETL